MNLEEVPGFSLTATGSPVIFTYFGAASTLNEDRHKNDAAAITAEIIFLTFFFKRINLSPKKIIFLDFYYISYFKKSNIKSITSCLLVENVKNLKGY